MVRSKKNVSINASNVKVTQVPQIAGQGNQKNRRARRRRQKNQNRELSPVPNGIQTGLSKLSPSGASLGGTECFSEQSCEFIKNYVDPCGEHTQSIDSARAPDGALQSSAGGFFRSIVTLQFPWQQRGTTDLAGNTYSLLLLQFPMLRNLLIVVARELDGEFDDVVMQRFTKTFSQIPNRADSLYPNWTLLEDSTLDYFTVLDTSAMRNIVPPNVNGVSGTFDSYRVTSQGINVYFNTPDLVDQGTYTCMRYPLDKSTKVAAVVNALGGYEEAYLHTFGSVAELTPTLVRNLVLNTSQNPAFPFYQGSSTGLPTPLYVAPYQIRNAAGTFNVSPGQSLRYEFLAPTNTVVQLVNASNGQRINVLNVGGNQINDQFFGDTRLYINENASNEGVTETLVDHEFTTISLPPVTQDAMFQQNPKMVANLLKDTEGVYLPSCIFQPVMTVTHASSYRKVLLLTVGSDLLNMIDPQVGWFDTVDENFGVSVINMQGIPYACKPMFKIVRTVEIVPSKDSIIGIFSTGANPVQTEALEICKAFTDYQPHGYPNNYNGLGKLFSKILAVTESLGVMLRSGQNLSRCVKQVCDKEMLQVSDSEEENDVRSRPRRHKRLSRIR